MASSVSFTLRRLDTKPKLNATLAERSQGIPRLMTARAIPVTEEIKLQSDFNGDGLIDSFQLTVTPGLDTALKCEASKCALFTPGGVSGISKLVPGDVNLDGLADFYLETTSGQSFVMENTMDTPIRPLLTRDTYRTHLLGIATLALGPKGWWDAVRKSLALTTSLSHTWVAQEPKPRYPWLEGTPPHTDCVIDLERTLAELHCTSGKFTEFQRLFNRVQKYDFQGPERTDFFTAEAVPHLIKLGMLRDLTTELHEKTSSSPVPSFTATINKEAWFRGKNGGTPSGKNFPEWKKELRYIPFEGLLIPHPDGRLQVQPDIAKALPPISIFVVMNKGRFYKNLGTEIPDSHVGYLLKDPTSGEVTMWHSTPTTDLGMAAVTRETATAFFSTRYCKSTNAKLTVTDKTAVGIQLYAILPPYKK